MTRAVRCDAVRRSPLPQQRPILGYPSGISHGSRYVLFAPELARLLNTLGLDLQRHRDHQPFLPTCLLKQVVGPDVVRVVESCYVSRSLVSRPPPASRSKSAVPGCGLRSASRPKSTVPSTTKNGGFKAAEVVLDSD